MDNGSLRNASLAGALGAALAASICCIGPLLLALLGLGGAGALVAIEPLRPLFTVLTVGLLAGGFWLTYRKRPAAATAGPECECEGPRVGWMGRVALWIVTVLVVVTLAFPYLTPYLFS
jgi:mercuric ion transport protein